jgi:hypothetical protein
LYEQVRMRKVGLLAFGVTTLLLTPAVLHELTAGPQQIAKLVAPDASSVQIGDATIDVSVDRAITDPGGTVSVKLVATAPKAGKVAVGMLVLEEMGTYNGRVPQPPNRVMLQTYTLDAAPGGGEAREIAVRLPGNRKVGEMQLGRYTVLVMTPKTAEKLDKLRRGAQREGAAPRFDPMESEAPKHGQYQSLYYDLVRDQEERDIDDEEAGPPPEHAARVDVLTRPASSAVAIRAPEQAVVGQELSIVVQVTNPTKRRVSELTVQLQQPDLFGDSYHGLAFEQVTKATESASLALGPHETKQVEFHLTANQPGTLGVWASVACGEECGYDQRLNDGNLEAIDIVEAPKAQPAVAAVH